MTRAFWLIVGAGLIYALLALPNHPGTMRWSALTRFPLEWPVLLFGMLALGLRRGVPALLALLLLLFFALLHGLRAWARVTLAAPLRFGAAGIAVVFAGLTVADAGHHLRYCDLDLS